MAVVVPVPGPATIKIAIVSGSLQTLGYARNESEIIFTPYYHNIHSDENGGDEGPEVEKQFLGVTAQIRMRLSKIDWAVMDIVEKFMSGASTVGEPGDPGSLLFAGDNYLRVLIDTATRPMNFLQCVPTSPIEFNHGTKATEKYTEFTAYKNSSGVLWNNTDS